MSKPRCSHCEFTYRCDDTRYCRFTSKAIKWDSICDCRDDRDDYLIDQLSDAGRRRVVDEWMAEHVAGASLLYRRGESIRPNRPSAEWTYTISGRSRPRQRADTPTAAVLGERDEEASDE